MVISNQTMLAMLVFRSLRNNVRISVWTLLTLATCAALVTLFATITLEVRAKMGQALRHMGANAVAYPAAHGNTDWSGFERVAQSRGIQFARLTVRIGLIKESPVAIVAADPQTLPSLTPYWAVTGKRAGTANECLVGRHVADMLGLKLGQRVNVEWPDGSPAASLLLVGSGESGDEDDDRVFTVAQAGSGDFSYALLSVTGGDAAIARLIKRMAAASPDIEMKPLRQIVRGEQHVLDKIRILCLTALGAVLALTALGVSASMLARMVERRKEFALLQALGAQRRSVLGFLLAESAALGAVAALAGFVIGTALAALVSHQIFHATVTPRGTAGLVALAATTLVALSAGGIACVRALRLQPAQALRGE